MHFIASFVFACLLSIAFAETCTKPEVSATSYITQDATVLTNLGFIVEFQLKCGNGAKGVALHAEVNGNIFPAVRVNDNNVYQVSWIDDPKKASTGEYKVALFDDEGYAAVRKASRSGEDTSSIAPLVTISLNFSGAYQGPWVNSEFMAAFLSILVWYLAFSAKSKLLA